VRPLADQTILVTGSTDGLGRRVAEELVKRDARVLVHGRDPDKVVRVVGEIGAERGLVGDLGSLDDVRHLADGVDQLDTLVNNAGIVVPERRESADGYELTFAVNYLSHFLLTSLLLPKLREPGRIVNVSSIGQYALDFDDLQYERDFNGYYAYAKSKLAQILFTRELAERLGDRGVTVNALHPATLMDTNMVLGPEQDIAAHVVQLQDRVRYRFWEAHSLIVDEGHVEFEAATRESSTGAYVTVHLLAQRARIPTQRAAAD